jgi:DNA-binding NtrC family response regulator
MEILKVAKILIVDDESGYRLYPSLILQREGHEVQTAADGPNGIEAGKNFNPDILIADWRLPDNFSGLQVREALMNENPNLQTIMITGYGADNLRQESTTGTYKVLEKPFELQEIITAVREVVEDMSGIE